MSVVVSCWDAGYDVLAALTWPTMEAYARRHGYAVYRGAVDPSRPASWSKIPAMLGALAAHPVALWIDADATITGDADLAELLGNVSDLAITRDVNGINAGVFIARSCPWVRAWLMAAWSLYPRYADQTLYEQPALIEVMEPYLSRVRFVPQRAMNSYPDTGDPAFAPSAWRPGDFILHAAGCDVAWKRAALESVK